MFIIYNGYYYYYYYMNTLFLLLIIMIIIIFGIKTKLFIVAEHVCNIYIYIYIYVNNRLNWIQNWIEFELNTKYIRLRQRENYKTLSVGSKKQSYCEHSALLTSEMIATNVRRHSGYNFMSPTSWPILVLWSSWKAQISSWWSLFRLLAELL